MRSVALAVLVLSARIAAADPSCDGSLRERLEREADRARTYRLGWAIAFGAAAIGQVAATRFTDDADTREGLWIGAAKATLGFGSRVVLPLRIAVPPRLADPCEDAAAVRLAIALAGRHEQQTFWLNHVGGFAVNAAGMALLAYRTTWKLGLLSFAVGYPVGLVSTYTMPRWAWHATVSAAPVDGGGMTVGIGGAW